MPLFRSFLEVDSCWGHRGKPSGLYQDAQALGIITGWVSTSDGKFVCQVPKPNGKLCCRRVNNEGGSVRNHEHMMNEGFEPHARQKNLEYCKYHKLHEAENKQCNLCTETQVVAGRLSISSWGAWKDMYTAVLDSRILR
ncbi:hypothetical protein PG987_013829 [Apiospora arundinis]